MNCVQCGNPLPDGAVVCNNCGAPTGVPVQPQFQSAPPPMGQPVPAPMPGQPYMQPMYQPAAPAIQMTPSMVLRICAIATAVIYIILGIVHGNMKQADLFAPHYFGSDLIFWLGIFPTILFGLLIIKDRNFDLVASIGAFAPVLYITFRTFKDIEKFKEFLAATSDVMNNILVPGVAGVLLIIVCLRDGALARLFCNIIAAIEGWQLVASMFALFYYFGVDDTSFMRLGSFMDMLFNLSIIFIAMAFKMERDQSRG